MKRIWDKQNKEPMYVINEKTLHNMVKKKIRSASRKVMFFDFGMIAISLFVGIFLIIDTVRDQSGWPQYLTALVAFLIAIFIWSGRKRRIRMETRYEDTLLGGLDTAISNMDYLIRRGNTFIWWYVLPFAATTAISFIYKANYSWYILLIIAAFIFSNWLTRWEVR